jgi:hypothetical protein
MTALRKNWWKILLMILFATFMDILAHITDGTKLPSLPLSSVSHALGEKGAVIMYFIIWLSILGLVCVYTEKWLSGSKWIKGIKYGIAYGLMMFFAACETNTIFGSSVIADFRIAAADSMAFTVFGILAGRFLGTDSSNTRQAWNKMNLLPILTIPLFYIIGRAFAYSILQIESVYKERILITFLWVLFMGISIAIMYVLIGRNENYSPVKKAMVYGLCIFGPIALFGNLFYPIKYQSSFAVIIPDYVIGRSIVDMVFIIPGALLAERIIQKYKNSTNYE